VEEPGDLAPTADQSNSSKEAIKEAERRASGRQSRYKRRAISRLIKRIEKKLESDVAKATVADFVRLLQLQKELEEETPKEIKVTWVEPSEEESASET
jgi:hypothetical protein